MIIGQATLGIEIMEQLSTIDTIILPTRTDGCGLTAAIAMIIKNYDPNIYVIVSKQILFYKTVCQPNVNYCFSFRSNEFTICHKKKIASTLDRNRNLWIT